MSITTEGISYLIEILLREVEQVWGIKVGFGCAIEKPDVDLHE